MTADKFVRRSLQTLSDELGRGGHFARPTTVGNPLGDLDCNRHVNVKRFTGPAHPDRNRQFLFVEEEIAEFRAEGRPILSVDTNRKELIGNFNNAGATWCPSGTEVSVHDFPSDAEYKAVPYGVYDVLANRGHMVVGTSADTPAFAADAIAGWSSRIGSRRYPQAGVILILADAGGSNGCRPRAWKYRLQSLADRFGLVVNVCHDPTGASRWNPVEHRLFGPIGTNWSGIPLRSPEVMLSCLRGARTEGGLRVGAQWQPRVYPKGMKVTRHEVEGIHILRDDLCPQWNYSIVPSDLWD